jgi:RNA polymerase sigma factor (sigma-70 family)
MSEGRNSTDQAAVPSAVEDSELLRRYAEERTQSAFAELVRRRIGLVYSVALRQTRGDRHRAADATQAVFTDLARKAAVLCRRPVLAGWLYRSAQFAAAGLIRAEQRRLARETEAQRMEAVLADQSSAPDWDKVRGLLDDVLSEMDDSDRDAILLRYFDDRPFAEIGAQLRLSENAARMRVERALDKLNGALGRRGITSSSAALGVALAQQIGTATPAGLAATVTGTALAQTAVTAGASLASWFAVSKLQAGLAAAIAIGGGGAYFAQHRTNDQLRRELLTLGESQGAIVTLREENRALAEVASEIENLRRDDAEFRQLAEKIATAQHANAERIRAAQAVDRSRNIRSEIDRMNREGNALVEEFKALNTRAKDAALTAGERTQAENDAKLKLAAIQAKQREIKAFIAANGADTPKFEEGKSRLRMVGPSNGNAASEEWTPVDNEHVSLRIRQADVDTIITVYERVTGRKIVRDPSIASEKRTFDLQVEPSTAAQLGQRLRVALLKNLDVVIEPVGDGTWRARPGPLE